MIIFLRGAFTPLVLYYLYFLYLYLNSIFSQNSLENEMTKKSWYLFFQFRVISYLEGVMFYFLNKFFVIRDNRYLKDSVFHPS